LTSKIKLNRPLASSIILISGFVTIKTFSKHKIKINPSAVMMSKIVLQNAMVVIKPSILRIGRIHSAVPVSDGIVPKS
jgi:hypothetical protein